MIKSFRGLLADGEQETIRLSTNNGMIGYKIKKFEIIPEKLYVSGSAEHIIKIYSVEQLDAAGAPVVDGDIDFDNSLLLGVAAINNNSAGYQYPITTTIVFDNVTVNQDIYVTHIDTVSSDACNYYIELEQIKLDLSEATVATLKDMRGS